MVNVDRNRIQVCLVAFPIVDSCNERERKEDEEKFPNFSSPATVVRVNYKDLIKKEFVRKC